jgi:hypothetical protein
MESKIIRATSDYRFFEIYYLDETSFCFKSLEDMELYINVDILGEGHFHEVREAK